MYVKAPSVYFRGANICFEGASTYSFLFCLVPGFYLVTTKVTSLYAVEGVILTHA